MFHQTARLIKRLERALDSLGAAGDMDLGDGLRKAQLHTVGGDLWRAMRRLRKSQRPVPSPGSSATPSKSVPEASSEKLPPDSLQKAFLVHLHRLGFLISRVLYDHDPLRLDC